MKILFITDNFPPEVNAPATRTYEHVKEWIKEKDVEVTILTCFPNFPLGRVFKGYKNKLYQKEKIDGIKIIRVWSYITENKGFLKRSLDYMSFGLTAFIAGLFLKYDIIIATSPQFFTTWAAFGLSKIKRKPWVFELRDLWPESIKAVGVAKNEKLIKFLEKIELGLYRDAKKVISVTQSFKDNLINRGINPDKIEIIFNGANLELFKPKGKDKELLKKLNLENKFVVGYIGTHGMAHGLDFIIKAISKIEDSQIFFIFIGTGATKESVVKLAKELGLKNVVFLDPIPKNEVPRYLSIIDVALVPLKKSDTFKTVIPSKIFEAAAMRKPILLGVEGESKSIVEKYEAGLCYEPENEKDFLEKTVLMKSDVDLYSRLQDGCEKLAKDFDRKSLAKKMLNILRNVQ